MSTCSGSLQLFWFDDPRHGVELEVLPGTHGQPPSRRKVEALARQIAASDGALLLVDGLRFPTEALLDHCRMRATCGSWRNLFRYSLRLPRLCRGA